MSYLALSIHIGIAISTVRQIYFRTNMQPKHNINSKHIQASPEYF